MSMNENDIIFPSDQVLRGLKAKLTYESCDLICTPVDRCDCDSVMIDLKAANDWIASLPGGESSCDGE